MIELSREDQFRLNVLLAGSPLAVRIDESRMIVYGLSDRGEAKVPLNVAGRPERYLRAVKELIASQVLGSPGGYPVYLRRWTRMGQMRDQSLEQLLKLGEPEAVVAAVCSPGLTDELARRAWWAMEDAENARRMLTNSAVVAGAMGGVLAEYLLEHLPFETETDKMTDSVRLMLQSGLISEERRLDLWKKSARKPAYLVGFLQAIPNDLPAPKPARPDASGYGLALRPLAQQGNPCADLLNRVLSSSGQTYLATLTKVLAKPPTQDLVHSAFATVRDYFSPLRPEGDPDRSLEDLIREAMAFVNAETAGADARACLAVAPDLAPEIKAMRVLSGLGYAVLRPVLRDTTAIGSLMRRKLQPVLVPVLGEIDVLMRRSSP